MCHYAFRPVGTKLRIVRETDSSKFRMRFLQKFSMLFPVWPRLIEKSKKPFLNKYSPKMQNSDKRNLLSKLIILLLRKFSALFPVWPEWKIIFFQINKEPVK